MKAAERFPRGPRSACEAADRYIRVSTQLTDSSAVAIKMFTVANLFLWHLDAFERKEDPVPLFCSVFDEASELLTIATKGSICGGYFGQARAFESSEHAIGEVFGEVYRDYSDESYFGESARVLRSRLTANDIEPEELFRDKLVLEAGCGGGKFANAIAGMGARHVIGVDIGPEAIAYAARQALKSHTQSRLSYAVGSVLDIPVRDESVDVVWSNSVIHLTNDWDRCFREAARVLKRGGLLYLYVDGEFGLFDLLTWSLRQIARQIPVRVFHAYLREIGVDAGRISWMIPTLYLPYAGKPREEVEAMLVTSGFENLRRLTRGIPIDQIEQVSAGVPYADVKYGDAQLKYLATKK